MAKVKAKKVKAKKSQARPKRIKLEFEKADIILALAQEPLQAGSWIHLARYPEVPRAECPVCAVGAVMRQSLGGVDTSLANRLCRSECCWEDPKALIRKGNYFGALSCLFENMIAPGHRATDEDRRTLIQFVVKHFPDVVRVSVKDEFAPVLKGFSVQEGQQTNP